MNYKERQQYLFQQARRNKLREDSITSISELNQKILKLTEDLEALAARVQTLEGTNG